MAISLDVYVTGNPELVVAFSSIGLSPAAAAESRAKTISWALRFSLYPDSLMLPASVMVSDSKAVSATAELVTKLLITSIAPSVAAYRRRIRSI
jgi:hypothetical protein